MKTYIALGKNNHQTANFKIVPIRHEDRFLIMQWRNEQLFHLRQIAPLTVKDQDTYFDSVIAKLFEDHRPSQLIFSFLEDGICIGYGGLVHINWEDQHAEISFLLETSKEKEGFGRYWAAFLRMIEDVAFLELKFRKIFTYAFDVRPHLYPVVEASGYIKEAVLRDQAKYGNEYKDVIIHSKFNEDIELFPAVTNDLLVTYRWASDPLVRKNSFNSKIIEYDEHVNWFVKKIADPRCFYYILKNKTGTSLGSIRLEWNEDLSEGLISYLVDPAFQGNNYGYKMLRLIERKTKERFLSNDAKRSNVTFKGFVFEKNISSSKAFEKLDYSKTNVEKNLILYTKELSI